MLTRITLAALLVAAAGVASGCASKKGYQNSENLADQVHACVASVDAYGTSRRASFESMSALVAEPMDKRPAKFEAFNKTVENVVAADLALRESIAALRVSTAARFQAWGEQNVSYGDNDMQVRSQKNRAEAAETFRKASVDVDFMMTGSTEFVAYLSDLRRVLSNDLSDKGLAGVSDFTAKARASGDCLDDLARPARSSLAAAADSMTSKDAAN